MTVFLLLLFLLLLLGASTAFPTMAFPSRLTAVVPRMIPGSLGSDSYVRGHCQPTTSPLVNIWRSDVPSPLGLDYSQEKKTCKLLLEAETLRAQAKAVMDQALAMEKDLKESRSKVRTSKLKEVDELIQQWLGSGNIHNSSGLANATVVAHRLQEQKATATQVLLVAERIFDRQLEVSGQTAFLEEGSGPSMTDGKVTHPNDASIQNVTLYKHLIDMMETLSRAVALVDERVNNNRTANAVTDRWNGRVYLTLHTHLDELRRIQRMKLDQKLAADINTATKRATGSVEELSRGNLSGQGSEVVGADGTKIIVLEKKMELVPLWVPATFLPFIISSTSSSLGQDEVKQLLDDVLMGSRFYVTSHHSVPGAAIFRGNIRGFGTKGGKLVPSEQPSAMAFADIQKRLQQNPGLRDRVQLFLLGDPEWRPKQGDDESEAKPVILALSTSISPDQSNLKPRLIVRLAKVCHSRSRYPSITAPCLTHRISLRHFCTRLLHGPPFSTRYKLFR